MMNKVFAAAVSAAMVLPVSASALAILNSAADFDSVVASSTQVTLPDLGKVGTGPVGVGPLTFDSLSGDLFLGGGFDSTLIPSGGSDTAISGLENLAIDIAGGATGIGFYIHEPTNSSAGRVDVCNTACVKSEFTISAFLSGALVGSTVFNPVSDTADFIGLFDVGGIDRIEIIETTGTNDNEFFGGFVVGRGITAVPVPASLPLLLAGLGGLAGLARKRRYRA
ncbi:MAG: VPLPA-CTERM sorting domain-containing protein [Pseudomonadota bacterium]